MKTEKKLAAGILPICKQTGRILLGRRSANDSSYPNHWDLFGGTFEDSDEIPKNTAKREFNEETMYCGSFEIADKPIDMRSNNFVVYYTYVGLFDQEFEPSFPDGEHCDFGWFHLHEIPMDLLIKGLDDTFKEKIDIIQKIIDGQAIKNIVIKIIKESKN